ncbi:MAG: AAA family ATPase [Candidatus Magasanikbacteria bacterium]
MYLKRLEIQGFKSFAGKTVLDFLPPKNERFSITAVVGPNGSGKSNVVDALRWVMGEQSIKALRGKKSEDIIFGGSQSKGQLGACEVSMVLDNSDDRVQIDLPEIVITRRLYRSGEGEYMINNNPVRLLDIHLLLAKAQFGQHSYSIIGQGTIDRLLTVSTAERKDFLDEASGIKEHQIKQHQANLKLARTAENMTQVDILLKEVEPRLRMLSKQVRKLEQRHEVEINLRETQEKYYGSLYCSNKKEMDRLELEVNNLDAQYKITFKELEDTQLELSELARSESRQEVFVKLQEKYQAVIRVKNEWERQLAVISGKIQNAYSELGKQNIGWLEKKVSELKVIGERFAQEQNNLENELKKAEKVLSENDRKVAELSRDKTQAAVRLSQLQVKQYEQKSERQYLEFSGLTAVKAVLENKNRLGKVYGLVAELGEVENDYRTALEVAAGQHLSSLVVADEDVARSAIEFLREQKMGVATFLPTNKIFGRDINSDIQSLLNEDGVIGLAIDLVKFDEKFHNIFSFVFGDTVIVKNLSVAQRLGIGRARMVTLDGDVAERRGVMKGGWRGQKKMHLSFSGRTIFSDGEGQNYQEDLVRQESAVKDFEMKLDQAKTTTMLSQMDKEKLLGKLESLQTDQKKNQDEMSEMERELNFLQMSPEEYGAHLSELEKEREKIKLEITSSGSESGKIEVEIKQFNDSEEAKKQRVFGLQESMQKKQLTVNGILSTRNEYKIQQAKLETKNEDLSNEVSGEMSVSLVALAERSSVILSQSELEASAEAIQKLKYQLSLIGGIDDDVVKEYETTKARYDFLNSQSKDLTAAIEDLSKMVEELDEIMKKKRSTAFKQIRKEFDRYFKILFSGGSAQLEEIYGEPESEDELDANGNVVTSELDESVENTQIKKRDKILTGIDIAVNPPGKKIKNINSLSGGERTLTSIALICAILNCNPSPFVVMDEVEAALDETNTLRFANIMSELASKSQFIIITHNRVTMHSADALYGVTMGDEGISKLLSVNIGEVGRYEDNGDNTENRSNVDKTA